MIDRVPGPDGGALQIWVLELGLQAFQLPCDPLPITKFSIGDSLSLARGPLGEGSKENQSCTHVPPWQGQAIADADQVGTFNNDY